MEIPRSPERAAPLSPPVALASVGSDVWMRYDRLAVAALLTLQLFLYFFWSVTQFPAAPGTWWQPLFARSGPVILPLMFGVQLLLIAAATPLAWAQRDQLRRSRPVLLLLVVVAAGLLTVPLAYLNHFAQVKIWKDVAFLSGYLLVPVVLVLGATAARRFFFLFLGLGFLGGAVGLAEAIHRASDLHLTAGQFLTYMYRVYAGGQYTELLLLFGALAMLGSYKGAWKQPLHALGMVAFIYAAIRFRLYFTRLYWIALGLIVPLTLILILPRRALRSGLIVAVIMGMIFVAATPLINALANQTDIGSRLSAPNNVSIQFRAIESKLLAKKVLARPLSGWGPGGTITPNIPEEPARNDTSSFFDGYLGVAYKFGVLVLGVLIAAIVFAGWTLNRALRAPLSRIDAAIMAGATVYLLGVLITSPAQDLLFSNFSAIPLALMMGIGLRLAAQPAAAARS
ncbi:MAG: hypothetical protein M3Z28_02470 [Candidatus Dormibacteraeota bacterium]|nr:hypothetical protein [Candidatus Dormibacteraeota bacterium]